MLASQKWIIESPVSKAASKIQILWTNGSYAFSIHTQKDSFYLDNLE